MYLPFVPSGRDFKTFTLASASVRNDFAAGFETGGETFNQAMPFLPLWREATARGRCPPAGAQRREADGGGSKNYFGVR
jgi:hypothetical protein